MGMVMLHVMKGSTLTGGQDNHWVLETMLGYSQERIARLVIEGVLE